MERREKILYKLGEGLTVAQIANDLKEKPDTIYKDLRVIKKRGIKFLQGLDKKELAYIYNVSFVNLFHVNKVLWDLIHQKDITDSDKIRACKAVSDNHNTILLTIERAIQAFSITDLQSRLEQLERINSPETKQSYFNLNLPHIINQDKDREIDTNKSIIENY